MEAKPQNQRYIIAVDPVISQQIQIAKAISTSLGTGKVKLFPEEHIYMNRDLTTFQADQILLDLDIESTFCKENFDIEWTAEKGFPSLITNLVKEYRIDRNLLPLKVIILGPPGVGKSTIARQLSDLYHLHHFTLNEIISSTRDLLKEVAGDKAEHQVNEFDPATEELTRTTAQKLLTEIDDMEIDLTKAELSKELVVKLIRYRLLGHPCQNQGFILDGFPETYAQAKLLFTADENSGEYGEDEGEGGDTLDSRLIPDRVFFLEAPDGFLKDRLASLPITKLEERHLEINYEELLRKYRELNDEYEKSVVAYFDEQEILYTPIDVVSDESLFMHRTINYLCLMLGRPRNYGISKEEEEALTNAQESELTEKKQKELEDLALLESRELEDRRKNIQKWMEKLAKVKKEEFEREESAMIPLRNYLMAHVVPTLTRGLIDVTRARPDDPVDFLAEYLFQNNPGCVSPVNPSNMNQK